MIFLRYVPYAILLITPITSLYAQLGTDSNNESMFHVEMKKIPTDEICSSKMWHVLETASEKDGLLVQGAESPNVTHKHGKYIGHPRDYGAHVRSQEKNDIKLIISTLSSKSLITIAKSRAALEEAGDRIDHLHPLKFLSVVFSDEELKVGIRNIRSRGWIWHDFIHGLTKSFVTESEIHNVKKEYIVDFLNKIGVQESKDIHRLVELAQQKEWEDFINYLIATVPRSGDHEHFDS